MPPEIPVDPLTGPKYGLEGRIVTMNNSFDVLDRGTVYVEDGVIQHVLPTEKPAPSGFEDAPVIRTGDTIYPGLIELHNHLSYNVLPLWHVPERYGNRGQWPSHRDYRKLISGPMGVLGRSAGYIEAVVRYVECKCLLGGVTTSQGIALYSNARTRRYYRGIVRNVEETNDDMLPEADTRIGDVDASDAKKFLKRLERSKTLLLHLAEGVDKTANDHFRALKISSGKWAITPALAGIHCAGLSARNFATLRVRGGSMVWSPLSNLLLYGETAEIGAAKDEGVVIALGSDWSPSGSKNLLGELKVAYLVGQEDGDLFTPRDVLEMATRNAAKILKWDPVIGSIEPHKRADFMVINGRSGDAYQQVLDARETSVTLVVINGVARYGQPRLMKQFHEKTEAWDVGGSERALFLEQEAVDPVVQALSLEEARDRLVDGMNRLPELAFDLENPDTAFAALGVTSASSEAPGTWFLELDHDGFESFSHGTHLPIGTHGDLTDLFTPVAASQPLSQILQPIELDPLTVADDNRFLYRIAAQRNLPDYIKQELPPLYGEQPRTVRDVDMTVVVPNGGPGGDDETTALSEFLAGSPGLSLDDRRLLVDQALVLLGETYVHLALKRSMHAVDPVQRLRLLQHQLSMATEDTMEPEREFHRAMTDIFTAVRDLHTNYLLPSPFKERTAYLPFLIEEYFDRNDSPRYLVSKVTPGFEHPTFVPGVEVRYWNGMPIRTAIERNADRSAGSNLDARFARGLDSLTIRPLVRVLPPDEEWVTVTYRALDGREMEIRREWRVWQPPSGLGVDPDAHEGVALSSALGFDIETDAVNQVKKCLYAPQALRQEKQLAAGEQAQLGDNIATTMPTVFRAKDVETRSGTFGYIRIFTFNVRDADEFVREFVRLVEQLSADGLIVDVRGNGGGLIFAAERLLQVLTPRRIEPERAQFVTTPLMLDIVDKHADSPLDASFSLDAWVPSMRQAVRTGAVYSTGETITDVASANDIGQRYFGPVVLITDALCYSATDMLAAGFQDHGIGRILGTAGNTGAGGANVWTHRLLQILSDVSHPSGRGRVNPFRELPNGASMRVSVRRTTRVGARAGTPVEDLGITPDERHYMTKRDVMEGNVDLIEHAAQILGGQTAHALRVTAQSQTDGVVALTIDTANIDRVDIAVDGRPYESVNVGNDRMRRRIRVEASRPVIEVAGYDHGALVARRIERV